MKFITIALLAAAILAQSYADEHDDHDHDSHACAQPKNEGSSEPACLALITKWYHNHATGKCEEFFYNGCGGNANNFDTEEKCKETCDEWHEKHKDHHHGHSHADHGDCHHDHDHSKHDHSHHH